MPPLASRLPEGERTFLLRSSVVDPEVPSLLVHREVTDGRILSPTEQRELGPVVVGPEPVPAPRKRRSLGFARSR